MEKQDFTRMSEIEYDLLDEMYFLVSFQHLLNETPYDEPSIKAALKAMLEKGWIRCYEGNEEQPISDTAAFEQAYQHYRYLATKEGLLVHNSQSSL